MGQHLFVALWVNSLRRMLQTAGWLFLSLREVRRLSPFSATNDSQRHYWVRITDPLPPYLVFPSTALLSLPPSLHLSPPSCSSHAFFFLQGQCPACGTRFVGPKSRPLVCVRCQGVVWDPNRGSGSGSGMGGMGGMGGRGGTNGGGRKDYKSDNVRIIDIDPE